MDKENWEALVKDTQNRIEKAKKRLKKIKHYECCECKKQYYSMGWCQFHKKRTGHIKFKLINQELKKNENG